MWLTQVMTLKFDFKMKRNRGRSLHNNFSNVNTIECFSLPYWIARNTRLLVWWEGDDMWKRKMGYVGFLGGKKSQRDYYIAFAKDIDELEKKVSWGLFLCVCPYFLWQIQITSSSIIFTFIYPQSYNCTRSINFSAICDRFFILEKKVDVKFGGLGDI